MPRSSNFIRTSALIILFTSNFHHSSLAASVSLELASINFTGNANGVFDPGKKFSLTAAITAINQTALSSSATLASSDPCVVIDQNTATYGDIPVSQNTSNSSSPFRFSISSSCPAGHLIDLTLTLAATGYSSSPIVIPVLVAIPSVPYIAPPYTCVTNYYVSTNGANTNNGTTIGTPWLTIRHAIAYLKKLGSTQGGVCVNVQPGTYNEYNNANGLSGTSDTPGGYLVFRSSVLHGSTLQAPLVDVMDPSSSSFNFQKAHYIIVDGFNLAGLVAPKSVENGVTCNGYGGPGDHIKVINNMIHDHGGAGVGANHTDYLTVEGNIVFGNDNTSHYEVSGISTWQAVASDTAPGFHNIISDNIVFNNTEKVDGHNPHSDGNGIIIDDFRNTQNKSTYGVYVPQTLVENNLVFGNGGSGIHVFFSDNVTVLNNTTMGNELDPIALGTWRGEINVVNGANNTFANNIAVAVQAANKWNAPNVSLMDTSTNGSNTNDVWANNLSFNGTAGEASIMHSWSRSAMGSAQGNLLGQDPEFVNTSLNEFTLKPGSPAIHAGTSTYGYPPDDLAGNARSAGGIDIGTY